MNSEETSEKENVFLNDSGIEFKRIHIMLRPEDEQLLYHVDKTNISRAVRLIFDDYIRYKKLIVFEKYMITFAIGMLLIGIGILIPNIYVSLTSMLTGCFMIGFSLFMYFFGRMRYEEKVKV